MQMRVLIIDELTRARVEQLVAFASANWYRPGKSETIPGNDARHVLLINSFRCVFSFTEFAEMDHSVFRHLSVSVRSSGQPVKYPNPIAFYTIASLFGFTGWDGRSVQPPKDWLLDMDKEDHCIVVTQLTDL